MTPDIFVVFTDFGDGFGHGPDTAVEWYWDEQEANAAAASLGEDYVVQRIPAGPRS